MNQKFQFVNYEYVLKATQYHFIIIIKVNFVSVTYFYFYIIKICLGPNFKKNIKQIVYK
jgi:hypothetical protein